MQTEFEIVVSEVDLDALGHVNNSRYLNFLESGRMDWYDKIGLFKRVEASQTAREFDTVVVNINIDFKRECVLGERLTVVTQPARLGRKSLAVHQMIKQQSGEVAAEAVVTSVMMDLQSRSALALPEELAPLFPSEPAT